MALLYEGNKNNLIRRGIMYTLEGKIEIDMIEFWEWIGTYIQKDSLAPPVFDLDCQFVEIKTTDNEGIIDIEMSEFWEFVETFNPVQEALTHFGVPVLNTDNHTIEVDFAASDFSNPTTWSPLPKAVTQWA